MVNIWSDSRIKLLKKLWEDGLSAREIASQLGDISRNAVIGKAHRLGLERRLVPEKEENKKVSSIPDMTGCRWPFGHPGDDDFCFCGEPPVPGKPYCLKHCMVAYRRKDSK